MCLWGLVAPTFKNVIMEFYVVKKLGVLRPYTSDDADKLAKMKEGESYKVKTTMPRNIKFHKKYFALLDLVFQNLPERLQLQNGLGETILIKSTDDLLWHVKMQIGHYEKKITLGGKTILEAKSISFAKMDNEEFNRFYNDSINVILKYFLPHNNKQELEEMICIGF